MSDVSVAGFYEIAAMRRAVFELSPLSDDSETRTSCVILRSGAILAESANVLPHGVLRLRERQVRPEKYDWIEHAERAAVYDAARRGVRLDGATAVLPWFPCDDCASVLCMAGVSRIVAFRPDMEDPRWELLFLRTEALLAARSVETVFLDREDLRHAADYDFFHAPRREAAELPIHHPQGEAESFVVEIVSGNGVVALPKRPSERPSWGFVAEAVCIAARSGMPTGGADVFLADVPLPADAKAVVMAGAVSFQVPEEALSSVLWTKVATILNESGVRVEMVRDASESFLRHQ